MSIISFALSPPLSLPFFSPSRPSPPTSHLHPHLHLSPPPLTSTSNLHPFRTLMPGFTRANWKTKNSWNDSIVSCVPSSSVDSKWTLRRNYLQRRKSKSTLASPRCNVNGECASNTVITSTSHTCTISYKLFVWLHSNRIGVHRLQK